MLHYLTSTPEGLEIISNEKERPERINFYLGKDQSYTMPYDNALAAWLLVSLKAPVAKYSETGFKEYAFTKLSQSIYSLSEPCLIPKEIIKFSKIDCTESCFLNVEGEHKCFHGQTLAFFVPTQPQKKELSDTEIINLIAGRITDEYRKHPSLDWAKIAATKIHNQWIEYFKTNRLK